LIVAIVSILLLGALGDFRKATRRVTSVSDVQLEMSPEGWLFGGLYTLEARGEGVSSAYAILARVPKDEPLRLGETYLAFVTAIVPRSVWPNKPLASGRLAGRTFFNASKGVPTGTVGEAYWNFHVPGVVLVFALWGVFLRWLGT